MNDNENKLLLRLCDSCPWATFRLRQRFSSMLRTYLFDRLGSELLATSCLYLTFYLLPELCGEIREGESVSEFLRLVSDCAVVDYFKRGTT